MVGSVSFFGSLESRFLSKVREDVAWAATWDATTGTDGYGVMLNPTVDMVVSHAIVTVAQSATTPSTTFSWGFNDVTTGYGAGGAITSMKSDGATPDPAVLVDGTAATAPTRVTGHMEVLSGAGATQVLAAPFMVIPIDALVVAADFFVFVRLTGSAVELKVALYGYDD